MKKRILILLLVLGLMLAACLPSTGGGPTAPEPAQPVAPANPTLILATTTSTQDSGLLDALVPMFQDQTGYTVQTVAVGTGAALAMAQEGNADVLLVHAPASEIPFMESGDCKDRFLVMHNDFVIVGPAADPAGIQGNAVAADAFGMIAAAEASFISRGDDSGTNKKELSIWGNTDYEPNTDKPAWYVESGQGMGATLVIASEKAAYTMTDRATRSEERRVGKECRIGCRSRWSPYH